MTGEETDHEEEEDRADERDDQAADQAVTDLQSDLPEEIAPDECPDDADDDVAEETEAVASHELAGQPACNRADDDQPKNTHGILLSVSEASIAKPRLLSDGADLAVREGDPRHHLVVVVGDVAPRLVGAVDDAALRVVAHDGAHVGQGL